MLALEQVADIVEVQLCGKNLLKINTAVEDRNGSDLIFVRRAGTNTLTDLSQLIAVTTPLTLCEQTLFGANLDQQGFQVGEDLVVKELAHPHRPLGRIHIAHANHTLAVSPGGVAHCHHTSAALNTAPTTKQNLFELGQVSWRTLWAGARRHRCR